LTNPAEPAENAKVNGRQGGSLASLRELNRRRVVGALEELGVASRAEVARRTGLSPSTVSTLVSELESAGLVVERDDPGPGGEDTALRGGRPPRRIALGRAAGVAVGIDFGKQHLAVVACDRSHQVLAETSRVMPDGYDARRGMDEATALMAGVLEQAQIDREEVIGVGVGMPGPIHLASWAGVTVAADMSERLRLPIHVDNDANLGALAELHWGAGKGCDALVYLKVATGIGAGLVMFGRLYRGAGGTAGEIGHTIIDESGPICRCASRGCLETVAGIPAIVGLLRPSFGPDLTVEGVLRRAAEGDAACCRALGDAGSHIGGAVANLCNLLNPARIVVGGTLAAARDVLLEPMRIAVQRRAIPSAGEDVEIVAGVLGDRAEVLGAVALVLYETEGAASAPDSPSAAGQTTKREGRT
jgi:predicted NBD/HSP70 family sugar kinase